MDQVDLDGPSDLREVLAKLNASVAIRVPRGGNALEFLREVYSNEDQPLPTRMRAAIAALPFETPKLAVTAIGPMSEGFAMQLERAISRSGKVIEAQAIKTVTVEAGPSSDQAQPTATEGSFRRL